MKMSGNYCRTMLTERKEKILDYSLELLMEQEQHTSPVLGI